MPDYPAGYTEVYQEERVTEIDWDSIKFRASSWGNLLTEAQSKADREAGILGATCQKELIKIYCQEVYGRKRDIQTLQMTKGKLSELESITLYSRVEKQLFVKNEEQVENSWATGHPDLYLGENIYAATQVDDIKSSYLLDTFMPKLLEKPDAGYFAQLNCYYAITGAQGGNIVYCLVDCPQEVLMEEKKRLLYSMNVISELSPEYVQAAEELERLLTFPDIDYRERVIKKYVPRDEELIQKMGSKVPIFRNWLQEFHHTHMNQYPKP